MHGQPPPGSVIVGSPGGASLLTIRSLAMSKHVLGIVVLGISTAVVGMPSIATAAQPCENLTSLKLPDTTITAAAVIQEGPFAPPAPPVPGGRAGAPLPVPSFCRVQL